MWLLILFDLPVKTKEERCAYTEFRKQLLQHGFTMRQFSVYQVHCASAQVASKYMQKIAKAIPDYGKVSLFRLSDLTFSAALHWVEQKPVKGTPAVQQLRLF